MTATAPAAQFRVRRATPASRVFAGVAVVAVAVLAALPRWGSDSLAQQMVVLFVYIALAQMWNLLAGFSGLVSVGQQAFFGIGGYAMVVLVNSRGQHLYWSVVPTILIAAAVAVPIGLLAFRLRGGYFAIGTWVIAEVVRGLVAKWSEVGAGSGVTLHVIGYDIDQRRNLVYWLALILAVGAVVIVYAVLSSRLGLALQAIRDEEAGARGLGTNVYAARFAVFLVAAAWTGLAGAVYYLQNLRLQPDAAFSVVTWTAPIIFIVVIGGLGTIEGPIVGAVLWFVLREQFSDHAAWYLVGVGVVTIIVAMFLRRGVWGTLAHRFGWRLLPIQRRLVPTGSASTVTRERPPG